ncbi:MAG: Gfo/Idh/MocA family oxidoreductase [Thaumarchaeota archaeon]|nr:MAG: Gfo/Idh/MocA family oxidoreductase [Nitrososphaerota archaeon]
MKFLVVGLGSMGKRRIRNLLQLNEKNITGFDVSNDRCTEAYQKYGIRTSTDINDALREKPDAMIISTPPDLHMKYAQIAIENKIHFFTEASVVKDNMEKLLEDLRKSGIIGLPSCTFRYHPIVIQVRKILEDNMIGKPLAFLYHSGQYLPDWHPWEDYRGYYVSKRNTGACREIVPFELVWLTAVFGQIDYVTAIKAKVSNLEVDIDDIYNVLLQFKNGIQGNITVDVITRVPYRQLKILGENGVITADWLERIVSYYTKEIGWNNVKVGDGIKEKNYIYGESMYVKEIDNFLKSIRKEISQPYTYDEDLKILNILEAIEISNDSGYRQAIKND